MKYAVHRYARRHLSHIAEPKLRTQAAEQELVQLFFSDLEEGYFVDVGASHPTNGSQSWYLEQKGWRGILVEPIPELCEALRRERPRSITVQAACGAPEQRGRVDFHVAEGYTRSSLEKNAVSLTASFTRTDTVDLRTLDEILAEVRPPKIDFVSIDVEGLQLNVLRGFDLEKHRPTLLLVEDHLLNLKTHRYLRRRGYRLVKRTARNSWYVPRGTAFALTSPRERFQLWRKVWLRTLPRRLRVARRVARKTKGEDKRGQTPFPRHLTNGEAGGEKGSVPLSPSWPATAGSPRR
jgi:FkbM family methyltransferase